MADFVVSKLMAELGLDTAKFTAGMKDAVSKVQKTSKELASTWNKTVPKAVNESENAMNEFHKTTRRAIKDISRVVTGILISQAFYSLLRTIRQGIDAVIDFSLEMEKSAIAFTQLLGAESKAHSFLRALEDLAAVTPIQITPLKQGAQQLLAMGFNARETLDVLSTLTDTISATGGGNQQLIQATQVLGKIRAMGKLSAREIRSLAVINIPIFDIMREELALTTEQIRNIGSLQIPAERAISAIVGGMQKRFDGLAHTMSRTMAGMISTIKDNLLFLGRDLLSGTFEKAKVQIEKVLETLQHLRDVTKVSGAKGFMQEVFSPVVARTLELLGKAVGRLGKSFINLMKAFAPFSKAIGASFLAGVTVVVSGLASLMNVLSKLVTIVAKNRVLVALFAAALAKLVISATVSASIGLLAKAFKALHIAQFATLWINTLRSAIVKLNVANLASALMIKLRNAIVLLKAGQAGATWTTILANAIRYLYIVISSHPIVAIITAIAGALVYLAFASGLATKAIDKFQAKMADVFALDVDLPDADEFAENMEDWGSGISDLGDSAEDAAEQFKKFLAPFDEINQIPEMDASDLLSGLTDTDVPTIEIPEIEAPGTTSKRSIFDKWLDSFDRFLNDYKNRLGMVPGFQWPPIPPFPVTVLAEFSAAVEMMKLKWNTGMDSLADKAKATWATLGTEMSAGLSSVGQAAGTFVDNISEKFRIREGVENFNGALERMGELLSEKTLDWETALVTYLVRFNENFNLRQGVENFNNSLFSMGESLTETFASWGETVNVGFENMRESFALENIKSTLGQGLGSLTKAWNVFRLNTGLTMEGLFGDLSALTSAGTTQLSNLFETNFFSSLRTNFNNLATSFSGMIDSMVAKVDSLKQAQKEANEENKRTREEAEELMKQYGLDKGLLTRPANGGKIPSLKDIMQGIFPAPGAAPVVPPIPAFANGGIINKDMLFRGGEGNRKEAVIPLESSAMKPFAQAIASQMDGGGNQPIMYVGTLIADDAGLRKLERKMRVIKTQEDKRRGDA